MQTDIDSLKNELNQYSQIINDIRDNKVIGKKAAAAYTLIINSVKEEQLQDENSQRILE